MVTRVGDSRADCLELTGRGTVSGVPTWRVGSQMYALLPAPAARTAWLT